jgi:hypothetical protein
MNSAALHSLCLLCCGLDTTLDGPSLSPLRAIVQAIKKVCCVGNGYARCHVCMYVVAWRMAASNQTSEGRRSTFHELRAGSCSNNRTNEQAVGVSLGRNNQPGQSVTHERRIQLPSTNLPLHRARTQDPSVSKCELWRLWRCYDR